MLRIAASGLAQAAILLLLASLAAFALLHLAPGDPAVLLYGPDASTQDLALVRSRWGLDSPAYIQYLRWLANAATGDLGRSYMDGRPVLVVIWERVPATLLLTVSALAAATFVGVAVGTTSAVRRSSWVDRMATLSATALYSTPGFWLGVLMILVFSVRLGWLPSGGIRSPGGPGDLGDLLRHLVLPTLALAARDAGRLARLTRASVLEVLAQDYVRTAAAKGLSHRAIATGHVLRNALVPVIALLGTSIPGLIGGAVVVETVFAWPGMGRLAIESALQRNYPVVMGEVLIAAALALLGSLLADLLGSMVDPRITRGKRS